MDDNLGKQNTTDDEVDLGFIFTAIGNFFNRIFKALLSVLIFIGKHKIRLGIIILIGAIIGYLLDLNRDQPFESNFIVSSNYDSADYLYNKVETIDKKIKQNDTIFLKTVFGSQYDLVKSVEIEPIVEIYEFIGSSDSNAKLFELLAEDENKKEFINAPVNSMNYTYHKVRISILGEQYHQDVTAGFFSFVNSNAYLSNIKEIYLDNAKEQIQQNNFAIKQIDSLISSVVNLNNSNEESKSLIRINENARFDELFERKRNMLTSNRYYQQMLVNDEIVSITDANYSVTYDRSLLESKRLFLIPIVLITLYLLFFFLRYLNANLKRII